MHACVRVCALKGKREDRMKTKDKKNNRRICVAVVVFFFAQLSIFFALLRTFYPQLLNVHSTFYHHISGCSILPLTMHIYSMNIKFLNFNQKWCFCFVIEFFRSFLLNMESNFFRDREKKKNVPKSSVNTFIAQDDCVVFSNSFRLFVKFEEWVNGKTNGNRLFRQSITYLLYEIDENCIKWKQWAWKNGEMRHNWTIIKNFKKHEWTKHSLMGYFGIYNIVYYRINWR